MRDDPSPISAWAILGAFGFLVIWIAITILGLADW